MVDIKLGVFEMVEQARAEIEEVDTVDAIEQAQDPDCLVIDIRDVRERKRNGYIPGSFHCPRGMIEFWVDPCLLYTSPSPRDRQKSRMPSSA